MRSSKKPAPKKAPRPAFPADHPHAEVITDALVRAGAAQTLPDLYDAWLKLKLAASSAAAQRKQEELALSQRAEYVLRSLEAARALEPAAPAKKPKGKKGALAKDGGLADFERKAEAELAAARRALAERNAREEALFSEEIARVQAQLRKRVELSLRMQPPQVTLFAQPVGSSHSLVQLARPEPEAALLLCFLLSGRLPTRAEAFFDDAVDDLSEPPPRFYPEEGLSQVRLASADDEDALCADPSRHFVPFKGFFPLFIPGHDFPRFRIVNRGPLATVLAREKGGDYAELMARAHSELLSGYFIRLQVEGRIRLQLRVA
jgi:hypothetical protein